MLAKDLNIFVSVRREVSFGWELQGNIPLPVSSSPSNFRIRKKPFDTLAGFTLQTHKFKSISHDVTGLLVTSSICQLWLSNSAMAHSHDAIITLHLALSLLYQIFIQKDPEFPDGVRGAWIENKMAEGHTKRLSSNQWQWQYRISNPSMLLRQRENRF